MHVKQVSNLFHLMELFARLKKPLSVMDIVGELGLPRSTVFNIVTTMIDHEYLYQPSPRGGYLPTNKWMELAKELLDTQPLPASVHELLVRLARQTGETLFLAAAEGTSVVFLDVVESTADIRFIANIGQRLPIHVTAAGRAILAQYSPQERAATLKRISYQQYQKDTFMTAESVELEIQKEGGQGWFCNSAVYAPGVAGIAVPFPMAGRRLSIALGGPISRIEGAAARIGKTLSAAVQDFYRSDT